METEKKTVVKINAKELLNKLGIKGKLTKMSICRTRNEAELEDRTSLKIEAIE